MKMKKKALAAMPRQDFVLMVRAGVQHGLVSLLLSALRKVFFPTNINNHHSPTTMSSAAAAH
jgi:hypothetical protein